MPVPPTPSEINEAIIVFDKVVAADGADFTVTASTRREIKAGVEALSWLNRQADFRAWLSPPADSTDRIVPDTEHFEFVRNQVEYMIRRLGIVFPDTDQHDHFAQWVARDLISVFDVSPPAPADTTTT